MLTKIIVAIISEYIHIPSPVAQLKLMQHFVSIKWEK